VGIERAVGIAECSVHQICDRALPEEFLFAVKEIDGEKDAPSDVPMEFRNRHAGAVASGTATSS
jgi:hypothetical protein